MKQVIFVIAALVGAQTGAVEPLLEPHDRLAIVGGTFVERMQANGALEAQLHARRPDWKLSVRNLGWSGDDVHGTARKVFGNPPQGFERLLQDVRIADPSVVLIAYGCSEASDGPAAVERFDAGLRKLILKLREQDRRVIMLSPVAMPGYRVDGYQALIKQCQQIVAAVGHDLDVPVIRVDWIPTDPQLTAARLLPNEQGYMALGRHLATHLVATDDARDVSDDIHRLIAEKNQLFFHRYRPQNETYLYLFRRHEQGNNAVEVPQFDPLIQAADEAIWSTAAAN